MKTLSISEILNSNRIDEEVEIRGWIRTVRVSKGGFSFISIHDGSCFDPLQVVADENLSNYDEITELGSGCAVIARGTLVESQGRGQTYEIQAEQIQVVGDVANPETYPISKKRHTFEYLRSVAHLRPRTNTFGAISRLRHATSAAVHEYFDSNGFFWVNTPIISASDCEGAGDLFRVSTLDLVNRGEQSYADDFFGKETFLAVSGQLNVEPYCLALSKVYTFGPTFRAENSNTSRHLAEFWMIEPEIAFADLNDNAALAEDFLKSVFGKVLEKVPDDIQFFVDRIDKEVRARLEGVIEKPFVHMTYTDAVEELSKVATKFEFPVKWGLDLQSEHETYLTQIADAPVVVTDYPAEIKAFYMRHNDDDKTVAAMDVLVPGVGEIIGGSQREERLEQLDSRMTDEMKEELWWYRDLRRYGTVPHAGFRRRLRTARPIHERYGQHSRRDSFPRVPNNAAF